MELIGRQREVAEVATRLRDRRLVTVIGPAGIGKTSLALSVTREVAADYELGAHVVDLTRVDSARDVAGAIAAQLGFGTFDALINSPSEQPALVVVDNCEHVTAAAGDAIDALLASCEAPRVLATSRSPLDLPGESLVVLGPLGVPLPGTSDTNSDSVRLFLDRALDAGMPIADDQLDVVARLCRQLDGVPLALEVAAARTRTMQPAEILDHLRVGLDVLIRPRFRGHSRHRGLSDTVDWSYRLLPADAAALFDRLGVFAGPFSVDLTAAVGADVGLDRVAADRALHLLVDSSLVVVDRMAATTRFRLFESMRMFALHRLTEQGVLDQARGRLADHVVAAAAQEVAGVRRWDMAALGRLFTLYDNAAASLRWCLANDSDGGRGLLLCALFWGVVHQGHTDEIAGLCEDTLARWPDPAAPFAVDAIATAATARFLIGDVRGAFEMAKAVLDVAETSATAPVTLRRAMAYAARALGDVPAAMSWFAEAADRARGCGLITLALEADVNRAQLLAEAGDLTTAFELARAAHGESCAIGSPLNEVWAQSILAQLELRQEVGAGLDGVSLALEAARRINYPAAVAVNLRALGWGLTRVGRYQAAAEKLTELFDHLLARGGVAELRGALLTTAELLHALGNEFWDRLAATAFSLPLAGPTNCAMDSMAQLPPHRGLPMNRRDAVATARRELRLYLAGTPTAVPAQTAAAAGPAAAARLVDRGQFWEVTFAGRTAHLRASKGMTDIGLLLSDPGREIHCLQLMGAVVEEPSTGEVLDQRARSTYEQRIRDLQEDIDAAEADHDYSRADRSRLEMDALVDHLTAALGLSGRARRSGGSAERARSAVTQRIRSAIRGVDDAHAEFARHLETAITTGTYCMYRPENPVHWKRS
ncbi:MAG TPA: hypothetical protein VIU11_21035 [Nakamurella sp.]